MNFELITEQVKQYVISYFATNTREQLFYHDIRHTKSVVAATTQIADHYALNEQDRFVVITAAWFHDMGYCKAGTPVMHEQKSADLADRFLKEKGVDEDDDHCHRKMCARYKNAAAACNAAGEIVCDADLFHLGTDNFGKHNKQVRKEYEATTGIHVSKEEWRKGTIRLLQSHRYHTGYCRDLLDKKKQENLEKLLEKEKAGEEQSPAGANDEKQGITDENTVKQKSPDKDIERPSKGIETMFRIAITNHQRLSDMADKKADIMISVNSIIISVVIGLVINKLEATPVLIIPTLMLLLGCATTVIFSILATRPKIPSGYFTEEQLSGKTANLLFFGNFYKMDYDHYYRGMQMVMADSEFLYASLVRDIYSQGKVLGKKYKLLRISYTVFMITLITTILAFCIVFFFM